MSGATAELMQRRFQAHARLEAWTYTCIWGFEKVNRYRERDCYEHGEFVFSMPRIAAQFINKSSLFVLLLNVVCHAGTPIDAAHS
jgi:hypothetical protein